MYVITKRMEIAGSHTLDLPYTSKCAKCHGHNWWITVEIRAEHLDKTGMVFDFTNIKNIINQLDHKHLNDVIDCNPTAENIAKWIADEIGKFFTEDTHAYVHCVEVEESEGNTAAYFPNDVLFGE